MKLFVDSNRKPGNIYRSDKEWELVDSQSQLNKKIGEYLKLNNSFPEFISFDYDLDNKEGGGLDALKDIIGVAVKLRLDLPKIYLHCDDRNMSIYFENALDLYTRATDVAYYFEYIKRN